MRERTAKTCGPDAAVLASSLWIHSQATVAKEPFTGESALYAVKPLRRECRIASAALYARVRNFLQFAHETAGAARIRHSLRPLISRGRENYL